MLVNSQEFWSQHYIKCTFLDAVEGAECEVYVAADRGLLPLVLLVLVLAEWLTA